METEKIPGKKNLIKIFFDLCKNGLKGAYIGFINFFKIFGKGTIVTKLSYLIMGLGCFLRGQVIKGILYFATQLCYIVYMVTFGWGVFKEYNNLRY